MVTDVSILLIITVVAAITLIQSHFSAQFEQIGKVSCPELKLFRAGRAMSLLFELTARKFRLKRLLCLIRAVFIPVRLFLRIAANGLRYVALLPVQPGWNPFLLYVENVNRLGLTLAISFKRKGLSAELFHVVLNH